MKKGTVKFFNEVKGFGFIKPEDSDQDIFVHKNGVVDRIKENDQVVYSIEQGVKGPQAVDVKIA